MSAEQRQLREIRNNLAKVYVTLAAGAFGLLLPAVLSLILTLELSLPFRRLYFLMFLMPITGLLCGGGVWLAVRKA